VKPFPSDVRSGRTVYRAVAGLALLFALAPIFGAIAPSVVTTDIFIVGEDEPIAEDVYVASTSGRVEGRIDGDLVITTGNLSISGTVAGDVLALTSGTVKIERGGVVEGSLRTVTPQVQVDGEVRDDLFVTGLGATIGPLGSVGRDLIVFGGTLTIDGAVGRDVRGRMLNVSVGGSVERDLDVSVQRLVIEDGASVSGDVLYRSTTAAVIAPSTVDGQVVQLPAQSNFIFGVILAIANLIGFLAFIVCGIILLWLFRGTGAASVEAIERHPVKTLLIGFLALIGAPMLVLLLAATLVGLPLAALLLAALLLGLVFGPVPAVTAGGDLILRRKGGLFGGFVLGAILWRLGIWLIPFVGAILYLIGLIWGVGGWVLGAWRVRTARPIEREALPPALAVKDDELPDGWEYPLPPAKSTAASSSGPSPDASSPSASSPSGGGGTEDDGGGQTVPDEPYPLPDPESTDDDVLPVSSPVDPIPDPDSVPSADERGNSEEQRGDAGGHDESARDEPGTDDWGLPVR
jgi:cytoskeletal protein CcmA (bactofilin family)